MSLAFAGSGNQSLRFGRARGGGAGIPALAIRERDGDVIRTRANNFIVVRGQTETMANIYDMEDTWNSGSTTYNAIKMNVTDSASATGSNLFLLQKDGVDKVSVDKNGDTTFSTEEAGGAWHTSSANYNSNTVDVSGDTGGNMHDVALSSDGTKMFVMNGNDPATIYQFTLNTPYDLTTANYDSVSVNTASDLGLGSAVPFFGFHFRPDGTELYLMDDSFYEGTKFNLNTAWDLSTIDTSRVDDGFVSIPNGHETDIYISPDGTKMFALSSNQNDETGIINQFTMSTAWDTTTSSSDGVSFDVSDITDGSNQPNSLFFKSDGNKLYVSSHTNIYEYDLATSWDISSPSLVNIFSVNSQVSEAGGIHFADSGSKLYLTDLSGTSIYRYDMPITLLGGTITIGNDIEFTSGRGHNIGTSSGDQLAFFGADPITQPSGTGTAASGFTAGTGTTVNADSTFTGDTGSTAYTLSDVVKHLKNLGLIAS